MIDWMRKIEKKYEILKQKKIKLEEQYNWLKNKFETYLLDQNKISESGSKSLLNYDSNQDKKINTKIIPLEKNFSKKNINKTIFESKKETKRFKK